jgi:hypothetical protein
VGTNDFNKGATMQEEPEDDIPMPPPPPVVEENGVEDVNAEEVGEYLDAKEAAENGEPVGSSVPEEADGEPEQDDEEEEEEGDDESPDADGSAGSGGDSDEGAKTPSKKITRRNWAGMDDTQRRQFLSEKIQGLTGKAADLGFDLQLVPLAQGDPQKQARSHLEGVIAAAANALKSLEAIQPVPVEGSYTIEQLREMSLPELADLINA